MLDNRLDYSKYRYEYAPGRNKRKTVADRRGFQRHAGHKGRSHKKNQECDQVL